MADDLPPVQPVERPGPSDFHSRSVRDEARKAAVLCGNLRDPVGLKKLLDTTVAHGLRLGQEIEKLNPVNVDEEKQIEVIKEVNSELEKLAQEINAELTKLGAEKK